jgi:hypothetical protein
MIGWAIFRKSVNQIYYNLNDALRISGLLWAAIFIITMIPLLLSKSSPQPDAGIAMSALGLMLVYIICLSWIAILWHRFMLLEERSSSLIPKWRGGLVWSYIKNILLISLVLIVLAIIPMLLLMMLMTQITRSETVWFFVFILIIGPVFTYVSLRLSLVLPAVAVEKPIGISQSWRVTQPASGAIMLASFLLAVFTGAVQWLPGLAGGGEIVSLIASFTSGWIALMVGISILTTLYGYLVENRNLD